MKIQEITHHHQHHHHQNQFKMWGYNLIGAVIGLFGWLTFNNFGQATPNWFVFCNTTVLMGIAFTALGGLLNVRIKSMLWAFLVILIGCLLFTLSELTYINTEYDEYAIGMPERTASNIWLIASAIIILLISYKAWVRYLKKHCPAL